MSSAPIAPLILFDLDGTLVDTAADLCAAANALRRERGAVPVSIARFRPKVSQGSRGMLAAAFPELRAEQRDALVPEFLARYGSAVCVLSRPFDGIEDVLWNLEARGARWGVVTNKPEALARGVMEGVALAARCAVLIGGDTLAQRKPDPAPLRHACLHLGVEPAQAVYVGDDPRDVLAARAAGMKSVAVAWGYREASERIDEWGADLVLETPAQLLIDGVLAPRRTEARV